MSDLNKSAAFYEAVLLPLGFLLIERTDAAAYFGLSGLEDFMICGSEEATSKAHVAFLSPSQEAVDQFFRAAVAHGGTERIKPSVRHEYHPDYYAAFVTDPDGNNIEAVHYDRAIPFTLPRRASNRGLAAEVAARRDRPQAGLKKARLDSRAEEVGDLEP